MKSVSKIIKDRYQRLTNPLIIKCFYPINLWSLIKIGKNWCIEIYFSHVYTFNNSRDLWIHAKNVCVRWSDAPFYQRYQRSKIAQWKSILKSTSYFFIERSLTDLWQSWMVFVKDCILGVRSTCPSLLLSILAFRSLLW